MTNPRPIQPLCKQGHEKKRLTTTGALYCPICQKVSNQRAAERKAAKAAVQPRYIA